MQLLLQSSFEHFHHFGKICLTIWALSLSQSSPRCPRIYLLFMDCHQNRSIQYNHTDLLSYSSRGEKSEMAFTGPKSRCWQGCIPCGGSGRNLFLDLFQLLEALAFLCSWPLPSSSKPTTWHFQISLWLYPWFLLSRLLWLQLSCLLLFLVRTLGTTLSSHA